MGQFGECHSGRRPGAELSVSSLVFGVWWLGGRMRPTLHSPVLQEVTQDFRGFAKRFSFEGRECSKMLCQVGDAPVARLMHQARAFCAGAYLQAAGVVGVRGDRDQAAAGEAGDDAAHGGRFDLLGGSEFAESLRAAENQYGKRGKTRGAFAGCGVLLPHAAQQVNGCGVQVVGQGYGGGVNVPTLRLAPLAQGGLLSHRTRRAWGTVASFLDS